MKSFILCLLSFVLVFGGMWAQRAETNLQKAMRFDALRDVDSAQLSYLRAFEAAKAAGDAAQTIEVGTRAAFFLWRNHKVEQAAAIQSEVAKMVTSGAPWQAWYIDFIEYAQALRNKDQARKEVLWAQMQEKERSFAPKSAEEQLRKAYILVAMSSIASALQKADLVESYVLSAQRAVDASSQPKGLIACEVQLMKASFYLMKDMKAAAAAARALKAIYSTQDELRAKYERVFYTVELFQAMGSQDTAIFVRTIADLDNRYIRPLGDKHPMAANFYLNIGIAYKDMWRQFIHDDFQNVRLPSLVRARTYMLRGLSMFESLGEGATSYAQEISNGYKQLAYMLQEDFRPATPEEGRRLRDSGELYFTRSYHYLLPYESRLKAQKLPMGHFIDFSAPDFYSFNDQALLHVLHGLAHLYGAMGKERYEAWKRLCVARKQLATRYIATAQNESDFSKTSLELARIYGDISGYYTSMVLDKEERNPRQWMDSVIFYSEQVFSSETRRTQNLSSILQQSGVPTALANSFLDAKKQLQQLIDLRTLAQSAKDEGQINQLNQQIIAKQMELDKITKEIEQKYPKYTQSLLQLSALNVADIQKNLDASSACIFNATPDIVFYICKDTVLIHQHAPDVGASILKTVERTRLYRMLHEPDFNAPKDTLLAEKDAFIRIFHEEFQRHVIKVMPQLKQRNIRHLIVVSGSGTSPLPYELFLCSPATLEQPYGEMDFLIKHFSVQYINSFSLWQQAREKKLSSNGKMLGFAPLYAPERVHPARVEAMRLTRRMLAPLQGAEDEINSIAQHYWGDFFLSDKATEGEFKSISQQPYAVIHLAMHGLLNLDNPSISSLAFAETMSDSTEDNFLHAYEIAALNLQSQLIVLSACETGVGSSQGGEGTMSLARYFLFAGAPAIVATRWQVNDQTTGLIMQLFYERLYEGKTIAQALHEAKLTYLSNAKGAAQHPFFWAAPMCIGYAETPVYIAPKDWQQRYWMRAAAIAGAALALGAGAWWYRRRRSSAA